jgi:hypothetical protein
VLDDHLDEMVRNRVRLVLIAVVVVVVVAIVVNGAFLNRDVNIEVSFRQQMEANVMNLEHEQQHHQHTQPPTRRGGLSRASGLTALSHYQFTLFQ